MTAPERNIPLRIGLAVFFGVIIFSILYTNFIDEQNKDDVKLSVETKYQSKKFNGVLNPQTSDCILICKGDIM